MVVCVYGLYGANKYCGPVCQVARSTCQGKRVGTSRFLYETATLIVNLAAGRQNRTRRRCCTGAGPLHYITGAGPLHYITGALPVGCL